MRRAAQRDDNEPAIIRELEQIGVSVVQISQAGLPDLIWGYRGRLGFMEVKNLEGGRNRLTAAQKKFWKRWTATPLPIVTTPQEAIDAVLEQVR